MHCFSSAVSCIGQGRRPLYYLDFYRFKNKVSYLKTVGIQIRPSRREKIVTIVKHPFDANSQIAKAVN